tara:strand:- start:1724 stop:1987 length:264 start_codon:yes stop_codon:yes gene_type:complete
VARAAIVQVKARRNENSERLIRRFIRTVKKQEVDKLIREKSASARRHVKPSVKKRLKREAAQRRRERDARRIARKRERARQRRLKGR